MTVRRFERQSTASAWLVTQEEPRQVLLVFHNKLQTWLQPGGHVEWNENPAEAAIREAREETGIDVTDYFDQQHPIDDVCSALPIPDIFMEQLIPPYGEQPEHYHVDHQYVVVVPQQAAQRQVSELEDIGWFTPEQAAQLDLMENVRWGMQQALAMAAKKNTGS